MSDEQRSLALEGSEENSEEESLAENPVHQSINGNSGDEQNDLAPAGRRSVSDLAQLEKNLRVVEGVQSSSLQSSPEELIRQYGQKLLGVAVVVLLGVWLVHSYRDASATRQGKSAQRYGELQQAFAALREVETTAPSAELKPEQEPLKAAEEAKKTEEKKADRLRVFRDNLQNVGNAGSKSAYGALASLYEVEYVLAKGSAASAEELSKAEQVLARFDAPRGLSAPLPPLHEDSTVIAKELSFLLYARLQLMQKKSMADIQQYLKGLVEHGRVISVEALVMMIRLADSEPARAQAISLAQALIKSRPELAETVEAELNRLGVRLS